MFFSLVLEISKQIIEERKQNLSKFCHPEISSLTNLELSPYKHSFT